MSDRNKCEHCGKLIRTQHIREIKNLVSTSFLTANTCNACATDDDFKVELEHHKDSLRRGYKTKTEYLQYVNVLDKVRNMKMVRA